MYSITPRFESDSSVIAPVTETLRALLQRLEAAASDAPSIDTMLERAAAYEATQPSYASDLRAAAAALESAGAA